MCYISISSIFQKILIPTIRNYLITYSNLECLGKIFLKLPFLSPHDQPQTLINLPEAVLHYKFICGWTRLLIPWFLPHVKPAAAAIRWVIVLTPYQAYIPSVSFFISLDFLVERNSFQKTIQSLPVSCVLRLARC